MQHINHRIFDFAQKKSAEQTYFCFENQICNFKAINTLCFFNTFAKKKLSVFLCAFIFFVTFTAKFYTPTFILYRQVLYLFATYLWQLTQKIVKPAPCPLQLPAFVATEALVMDAQRFPV
jgi:hypothetical protein